MTHGFEATSLRSITAAAGVNLAAVNYHFGSKEELFQAVLTRRLDPMNQRRVDLLSQLEREAAPSSVACDKILAALFIPALELARDPRTRRDEFPAPARPRLRRSRAVHPPVPERAVRGDDRSLQGRVRPRAARAARKRELSWRLHFMMGALSYTLAGTDALKLIAELAPGDGAANDELLLRRLAPFLLAGLTSPRPDFSDSDRALDASLERRRCCGNAETPGAPMLALLWFVACDRRPGARVRQRARRRLDRDDRRAARGSRGRSRCCPRCSCSRSPPRS